MLSGVLHRVPTQQQPLRSEHREQSRERKMRVKHRGGTGSAAMEVVLQGTGQLIPVDNQKSWRAQDPARALCRELRSCCGKEQEKTLGQDWAPPEQ